MKITVLGCGNSVGVPVIGCDCPVCCSPNPKNIRRRCSILVQVNDRKFIIDSSPDFRAQALEFDISSLDFVLYTHIHYDHTAGIHELSAVYPASGDSIPIYADDFTLNHLVDSCAYLFQEKHVGGAPWKRAYLTGHKLAYYEEYKIKDISCIIFPQEHGSIISSGIILNGKFAYCTDVRSMPDRAIKLMRSLNLEVLIIECFSYGKAKAHSSFDECMAHIAEIAPKKAFLTHMTHELEYDDLVSRLQSIENVLPAYDGLSLNLEA